jgi:hypothetical protein
VPGEGGGRRLVLAATPGAMHVAVGGPGLEGLFSRWVGLEGGPVGLWATYNMPVADTKCCTVRDVYFQVCTHGCEAATHHSSMSNNACGTYVADVAAV